MATALTLIALAAGPAVGTAFGAPVFSVSSPTVAENAGPAAFGVTCTDNDPAAPDDCNGATATFNTQNGTAVAPGDYAATNMMLTFMASGQTQTVNVAINDDVLNEDSETFTGTAGGATGTATITDNDPLPSLTVNDLGANENTNNGYTVTLSQPSGRTVTVNVFGASGSAALNGDFSAPSPTQVFFAPGETNKQFFVSHFCDNVSEGTETYTVNLSGQTNATIADGVGLGTIFDTCGFQQGSATDLLMIKEESADPIQVGSVLVYTLRVQNLGPNPAFNVRVTDPLPDGMQFVSTTFSQGNCSGTATLVCDLGTINSGAVATIELRVRPTRDQVSENRATVTSSTADFNTANNTAVTQTRSFAIGTPPPAPVDNPTADVTAPIANLAGSRRCELLFDRACLVEVVSSENGEAIASGRIIVGRGVRSSASFPFRRARRRLVAFQQRQLPLKVSGRTRRLLRRALRRGRPVRARIRVVVRDQEGNERVRRRTLRIAG